MKNRFGVVTLVLAAVCLGLGLALLIIKKQAVQQQREDTEKIEALSNDWAKASGKLEEQMQVSDNFQKDLDAQKKVLADLTNNFTQVTLNLSQANSNLSKTETALKASEEEIKKRDARIAGLETQNQALDKQAVELSAEITSLTGQIGETKRRLSMSEGDKAVLETSLKRLLVEKAELERQFNDLTILRAQVTKLKEEMTTARRLAWIRLGLFHTSDQKGGQQLMQGFAPLPGPSPAPRTNFNLNVEFSTDGGAKIGPAGTNAPASTNSPPK